MTFSIFMDLDEFLNGNGPNAQYTSISEQTISITNGQIVGNQFLRTYPLVIVTLHVGEINWSFWSKC